MRTWALTTNERAECGHTHLVEITADDLVSTTAGASQTFTTDLLMAVGSFVERVTEMLVTPFQNTNDAAQNTTAMTVGDSVGGAATILASTELNFNGASVPNKTFIPTGTPSTGFTAPTYLTVTIGGMAAKNLNAINRGVVLVAIRSFNPRHLATTSPYGPPQTKP
jgi:hypothetical protein